MVLKNVMLYGKKGLMELQRLAVWIKRSPTLGLIGGIGLWLGASVVILDICVWAGVFGPLPQEDALRQPQLSLASEVWSADSVLLGRYYLEERSPVDWQDVPPHLVDALLATEDIRFFRHHGIDDRGLLRAVLKGTGGGSTLTQQLAKNLFPRQSYPYGSLLINKLREMRIAQRLEHLHTKEELLTWYLNTVFWGHQAYGLKVASFRYFGKHPRQLDLAESALLVAMLKGPSAYNPLSAPEAATARRNLVFAQMRKYQMLTEHQKDSLQQLDLILDYHPPSHHAGKAPFFRAWLRQELASWIAQHPKPDGSSWNLYTDGLTIETSLDAHLQEYAEQALLTHLDRLQPKLLAEWRGSRGRLLAGQLYEGHKRQHPHWAMYEAQALSEFQIDSLFALPTPRRLLVGGHMKDTLLSIQDSITYHHYQLQASFLAIDPQKGHIKAWVGGRQHEWSQYDHVLSRRQTGSVFKPVVYGAALRHGISPCAYIANDRLNLASHPNWSPENSDRLYGGQYSMAGALTHSVNVAAVKLLMQTGAHKVVNYARDFGMPADLPAVPSLALGTAEVSLYDMVRYYAMIANGGIDIRPTAILRIKDAAGNVLFESMPAAPQSDLHEEALYLREMLRNVVRKGTARGLRSRYGLHMDLAGKTGTTQRQTDGWFMGMTPWLVAGTWVGADDQRVHFRSMGQGQGAATAMPIFGKFMQLVSQDPAFQAKMEERFPPLPPRLRAEMDCEEFSFPMSMEEFKAWWQSQQDSIAAEGVIPMQ